MVDGLVIGGWFVSAFVSMLIKELVDYGKKKKKQLGLEDELKRLGETMPMIEAILHDADPVLIREENRSLWKWLLQLRDAVEQAYNVLDNSFYDLAKEKVEAGKKKVSSNVVSDIKTLVKRAVDKDPSLMELKEAVKAIDSVADRVGQFSKHAKELRKNQNKMNKSTKKKRDATSVFDEGTCKSVRKKEKAGIIKRLLKPERKIEGMNYSILPIIGQGPVGKTNLARVVYNDPDVQKHFDLKMWVCINTDFNVTSLTEKLYESVFGEKPDFVNPDTIHTKLSGKLKFKKFLVVFDDAWNDDERAGWEKLLGPLKGGAPGSMILLTTRMESVARLIGSNRMDPVFLEGYNNGDMWKIVKRSAFGGKDPNCRDKLAEIGRDIVKKLKGSALAAKAVGDMLRFNLSEKHWRRTLKKELWRLEKVQNEIMPHLRLTYQNLPSHLKPYFSFCSIFPQNHIFLKDDLIHMWIALGLVQHDDNGAKTPEDVGSEYFDDMLNKSIFIRANQDCDGYVMHDLMQELATFVSKGECFRTTTNGLVRIPKTVRHLYVHVSDPHELNIFDNSDLKNVHTLVLHFDEYGSPNVDSLVNEALKIMKNLRVLSLFACNLSEFPESASNLLHLRYLGLSFKLRALPKAMSRLYLLKTLVFNEPYPGVSEEADHIVGRPSKRSYWLFP